MDAGAKTAITEYINKFELTQEVTSTDQLFQGDILLELTKLLCENNSDASTTEIDTFVENSVIEGFNSILNIICKQYKNEYSQIWNPKQLGIDTYDLVHDKEETQLFTIIKLLIGVIINSQHEDYIKYMMEMDEEEAKTMEEICQDAMQMTEEFEKDEGQESSVVDHPFGDSPGIHQRNSLIEQKYIDKINSLNLQVEAFDIEKRTMRLEISEEKKLNAELSAKVEKMSLDSEELKSELQSLEKYKEQWEKSISVMKESECQEEFLKQVETELAESKATILKYKKEVEEAEQRIEEETHSLREEIENLQIKNLDLIKHESMVNMYKKKLDSLKDIKQEKREIELERDNLRSQLDQSRSANSSKNDNKKVIQFYKNEVENFKLKITEFEDALKAKNNEIVKLKNSSSKVGREMEVKDKQISTLQNQLDEMMDKPDDSSEEYLLKIKNLENQIKTLRKEDDDNELRDQVIALEVSPHS